MIILNFAKKINHIMNAKFPIALLAAIGIAAPATAKDIKLLAPVPLLLSEDSIITTSTKCRMEREMVLQMCSDILGYMIHHRSRYSWENGWFRCTDNRTIYTLDRGLSRLQKTMWSQVAPWSENIPPKGVSLSDLICIFAMSIVGFSCLFFATLR